MNQSSRKWFDNLPHAVKVVNKTVNKSRPKVENIRSFLSVGERRLLKVLDSTGISDEIKVATNAIAMALIPIT